MSEKILIVISGPSGVGKRCIMEGIELYCKLQLVKTDFNKVILYNTREIREGELDGNDYHFCYKNFLKQGSQNIQKNKTEVDTKNNSEFLEKEDLIPSTKNKNLFMFSVRKSDLQAIDLFTILEGVNFLEIYDPFFIALKPKFDSQSIKSIRLFVSPLSRNEIRRRSLDKNIPEAQVIRDEMSDRISERRKFGFSNEKIKKFEKRINDAVSEIDEAFNDEAKYDAIIVNPYGEADSAWGTKNTMPFGGAREVINTVCEIINARLQSSVK